MLMLVISESLSERLTLYPRAKNEVTQQLSQAFQTIADQEFRDAKYHICLFEELMVLLKQKSMELHKQGCVPILEAVSKGDVFRFAESGLALFAGECDMENMWDDLFRRATDAARNITDSQFLSQLREGLERFAQYGDLLKPLADKAKERAFAHLADGITRTTNRLMSAVHKIQEQDCMERIKRERASLADEEQRKLRVDLIRQVNTLSAHAAHA